jgi:hypothetical protein
LYCFIISQCNQGNKRPKRFNVVGAMENIGKEFVREAGEMAPETMADNLMPVLTHLLPEQEQQKRWCQQMILRLGLESLTMETPNLARAGAAAPTAAAATTPPRITLQAPSVTPATEPRRAPTLVKPRQEILPEELENLDPFAMYCHPTNPEIAQPQSTASTQRCRLRNRLKGVMESAGTKPRQAVVIHDYCTQVAGSCIGPNPADGGRSRKEQESG